MKLTRFSRLTQKLPACWFVWTRRLFIPIALGFLAFSAYRASDSLAPMLASVSVPQLLIACLCWSVAQWTGPLATTALARTLDVPMGYRELALIAVLRLPAKYLPGGIWQSVARFAAYRERHVRNADSLTILLIEHLIALGASAAMGATVMLNLANTAFMSRISAWILAAGLGLVAAVAIWIAWTRPARAQALLRMSLLVAAMVAFWCLAALAFVVYWMAIFDLRGIEILRAAAGYLLSWAAGFAVIFAPQGLGVFEWVGAKLLPSSQTLSTTVIAVAGFRLVTIAGDLVAWTMGVGLSRVLTKRRLMTPGS